VGRRCITTNTSQRKLRAHENDLKVSGYVCCESSHGLMLCRRREVCGERAVPPRGGGSHDIGAEESLVVYIRRHHLWEEVESHDTVREQGITGLH
jgi:hypothetical protein